MKPQMVELILKNVADGVFTVDHQFRITFFNHAAEEITGVSGGLALGRPCAEIFRTPICGRDCPLRQSVRNNLTVKNFEIDILTHDNKQQTVSVSTAPLIGPDGKFLGGVETFRDLSRTRDLHREVRAKYSFQGIVSKNAEMRQIFETLPNIAQSDAAVLLQGAQGNGKDLFAAAIHNVSPRSDAPFVKVSCESLSNAHAESHINGFFQAAERGTLYLDGVDALPMSVQTTLLRLLKQVDSVSHPARGVGQGVRIVTATQQDLRGLVADGSFREALYCRLAGIVVFIPELKKRHEDIPLLADHFLERCNQLMGRSLRGLTNEAVELLTKYDFPDNVRELKRIVEFGYIAASGPYICAEHLPPHVSGGKEAIDPTEPFATGPNLRWPPDGIVEERQQLVECLQRNLWSIPRTARELGIHRTTLWRKVRRLNIIRPGSD